MGKNTQPSQVWQVNLELVVSYCVFFIIYPQITPRKLHIVVPGGCWMLREKWDPALVAAGASQPFPALSQALSPSWGSSPSQVKEQQQPEFKGTFPKLADVCFHNWKPFPCTTVVKTNSWSCECGDNTGPEHSPAVGKAVCANFQRCQLPSRSTLGARQGSDPTWGCSLTKQNPCWMGPPSLFQPSFPGRCLWRQTKDHKSTGLWILF